MSFIKSPYNFVPLNKSVVIPAWGKKVSHDIPFQDGTSGRIELKIKAHSDIFVRDETKEKASTEVGKFTQFRGEYFLPGTSLKGMIRNVLEVMTFSKMKDKVNPHRYAIRDLAPSAKAIYMDNFKAKEIHCGWLRKTANHSYVIDDCGKPGRISHRELDRTFNTSFDQFFSVGGQFKGNDDNHKAARYKYQAFKQHTRNHRFANVGNSAGRELFAVENNGAREGTIVFTGQPGQRKKGRNGRWSGHHLEFIFFDKQKELTVADKVMEDFFFAYYEHDKNQWSVDWAYWRELLKRGEKVPVFFRVSGGEVVDFGLSFLYKLPYKNSIDEAIAKSQKAEGIDMSQAIFGYTQEQKGGVAEDSLKGRVHIGHAFAIKETAKSTPDDVKTVLLSGPKASYYPNYIRQNIRNGRVQGPFRTLMDAEPEIAGWKRYPIRSGGVITNLKERDYQTFKRVSTSFVPLKAGVEFKFTIRFHNLKQVELGALLSALTFHNTRDTFHSIGMAKPLGYGKISLTIEDFYAKKVLPVEEGQSSKVDQVECMAAFEAYMNASLPNNNQTDLWHQSPQIADLIAMVSEQEERVNEDLKYMKLGMGRGEKNQFVEAKKNFQALDRYTNLAGVRKIEIQSLVDGKMVQKMADKIVEEQKQYGGQKTKKAILYDFKMQKALELEALFEKRKKEVIAKLLETKAKMQVEEKAAKAAAEEAEIAARRKERMANTQSTAPSISEIDVKDKRAFDKMRKIMRVYLENYHGKRYKGLKGDFPNGGMLAKEFHDEVIQKVQNIYKESSKRDKKNWGKPFAKNADLKIVADWIGKEKATTLLT